LIATFLASSLMLIVGFGAGAGAATFAGAGISRPEI
jgi:hypothetical protein